jgi:hypothetical protein
MLAPNSLLPVASVANLKAEIQRRKDVHPDLRGDDVGGMALGVSCMGVGRTPEETAIFDFLRMQNDVGGMAMCGGSTPEERIGIGIRAAIFDFLRTQNAVHHLYDFQLDSDAALEVLATMPLKVGSDFDGEEFVRLVKAAEATGS